MRISDWSSDVCSSDLYGADWNIDKEGIVPAQIFGQPATDQRPHDRTQNHCHAEQRHADRLLMGRQSFRHDGHRSWYQRTTRSEEHTSELQSLMRISYAVFCLKKQRRTTIHGSIYYDQNH